MLWFLMLLPFLGQASGNNQPSSMIIEVEGHHESIGEIHIGLFQGEEGFPDADRAIRGGVVPVTIPGPVRFKVNNLKPGKYALAVFQDLNGNGRLDTNIFGIPIEPYGFSNAVRAKWRKPSFQDAAILFQQNSQVVRVKLVGWSNQ